MEDIIVPIAFFAASVFIVYFVIQAKLKRAKMEHEERMLAMEKGIPVPPRKHETAKNPYKWPLILIGLGVAWFGVGLVQADEDFLWSMLPLIVGVGLLMAHQHSLKTSKDVTSKEIPAPTTSDHVDKIIP